MRFLVRLLLLAVAPLLVVVAPGAAPSHACSCADQPIAELIDGAEAVFIGQVLEEPRAGRDGQATFRVRTRTVYKGEVTERVQLTTPAGEAACGITVREGQSWTFLTSSDYAVGLCGGSAPVEELSAAEVEQVTGPSGPPLPGGVAAPDQATDDDGTARVVTRLFVGLVVVIGGAGAVLMLLMLRAWHRGETSVGNDGY